MSEKTTKLFSKINSMALILFAFIFLAVSSCELEIGLGASVDTEPPTIEITLPSTSANSIRGSFPIKGKCFDDGVVNVVTLTVKETGKTNADPIVFKYERTEKDKADSTNTITLSEKDTLWECFLDPNVTYQTSGGNDATLKDGSYEAVVEIADLLGHTATDKVIFTVDNTPPILVLQRPSSKDGDLSLDSFGQELSIEGQAYDASDVKRIEVKIFQNDGTGWKLWDTAVLENVPPTVDLTVMKWTPAQGEKYIDKSYDKGGYKDLYGDDQYAGDKQYRCEIVAYDDALPCPNEGEGAGYGNKAEFYYLYEDIYSSVLSEGYKLTQIYSMMNGTDTETAADKIKTVLDTLKSNEVKDGGSFTLNPLNNPTYSISGYDAANKDDVNVFDFDKNNVVIGSVITVKISSGLDQIPLKNDSIGISLVEIDPADPVTKNDKGDITGIKAKKKADGKDEVIRVFKTKDEWDESKDGNRDDKIKKLGNLDRTVSLTLSKDDDKFPDLKTGAYYALKVDVKDEKGNDGDNNGIIYGFRLISTGSGPTINDAKVETTPANDEKNVNSTGSIKITADVSYTEKITMALYLDEVKKENKVDGDFKTVGGKYVWENNDLETLFNSTEGSKNFVIVANADDGTSAKVERRVTYDKTAPTIQINSPKDNTGESAIINKKPTFRGTVFDTGTSVKAVYYAIKNKGETAPTVPAANNDVDENVWKKTTGKESWTISLENTPIVEGNYVLYLFAEDGAYNRTELVKEEFDVDTKSPTVKTEIGSTVIPDSKLNTQTASYGLKITVEDTYKVDENAPEVVVDKDSETLDSDKVTITKDTTNSTSTKAIYTVSVPNQTDGLYTYTITAKDAVGKGTTVIRAIRLDTKGPEITVNTPDLNEWQSQANVKVTGSVVDDSKVSALYYSTNSAATVPTTDADKEASWTNWVKATNPTSLNFILYGNSANENYNANSAVKQGKNTLKICAVDEYGNVTEESKRINAELKVDTGIPKIQKVVATVNSNANLLSTGMSSYLANTFTLSGEVAESNKLEKVTLSFTNNTNSNVTKPTQTINPTETPAGSGIWTWSYEVENFNDAEWEIEVKAEDEAGKDDTSVYTIGIDSGAPVFAEGGFKYYKKGTTEEFSDEYANVNALTITVPEDKLTDSVSRVSHIEYALSDKDVAATDDSLKWLQIINGDNGSYTVNLSEGNQYIYLRAADNAGNYGYASPSGRLIKIDIGAPTLEVTAPVSGDGVGTAALDVKGTANDSVKLASIAVYKSSVADTNELLKQVITDSTATTIYNTTDGTFALTVPKAKIDGLSEGNNDLIVVAKDEAGNQITQKVVVFKDTFAPDMESKSVKNLLEADVEKSDGTKEKRYDNVNGKLTWNGASSDSDKVDSTELKIYTKAAYDADPRGDETTAAGLVTTPSTFTATNWTFEIDTTKLTDETEYILEATSTDRSGNTKVLTETIYVNQATDNPTISFTSIDPDGDYEDNVFGVGSWVISGNAEDDDGVNAVAVYNYDSTKTDGIGDTKIADITLATNVVGKTTAPFKYTIPHDTIVSGEHDIVIVVTDTNSSAKSTPYHLKYAVDNESPVFAVPKITGAAFSEVYTEGMFGPGTHDVEFTVSDDVEVVKLEYYDTSLETPAWVTTNVSTTSASGSKTKVYKHAVTASSDGEITRRYKITDKYGRESETTLKYNVDTVVPEIDTSKLKVKSGSSSEIGYDNLAKTWFNNTSVSIIGNAGVVKDSNLASTVNVSVTGDTTQSGTIEIGVDSTKTPNEGNVNDVRAFGNGKSTVKYTFKDKSGNAEEMSFTVNVDSEAPTVSSSSISAGGVTLATNGVTASTGAVTKENTVNVTFTASDGNGNVSGLATAYLGTKSGFDKTSTTETLATITLSETADGETTYPFTKTITNHQITISDATKFPEGKHEIWLRLVDRAGNEMNDTIVGSFTIDRTEPEVTYENPKNGDTVNKVISLTGKFTDSNIDETVSPVLKLGNKVLYEVTSDGTTNLISGMTYSHSGKQWTFSNVNTQATETVDGVATPIFTEDAVNNISVVFTDKAGNKSTDTLAVTVDQDSDRPVITLNGIKTDGSTTLNAGVITGSVEDDDGVSTLEIQLTAKTATKAADDKWVSVTVDENGKFSYTIPNQGDTGKADGNYKVWFRVKDSVSTDKFVSSETTGNDLSKPRIVTQNDSTPASGSSVAFDVDSEPPSIDSIKIAMKKADGTYADKVDFRGNGYLGGQTQKEGKLYIEASDSVTDVEDLVVKISVNGADDETLTYDSGFFVKDLNFAGMASGNLTMIIKASDKSGVPKTASVVRSIDNNAPDANGKAVSNVTPAFDTEVTGIVTVKGTLSDDNTMPSGVDPASVYYYIPQNNATTTETAPSDWSAFDTDPANPKWTRTDMTVDATFFTLELKNLATSNSEINPIYAGYETGTNTGIFNIPIWFKISDNLGNTSYVTRTAIKYNPDAARPRIKITYPVHSASVGSGASKKEYVVLGGKIRIAGSSEDNMGVAANYAQFDVNGDGKYSKFDVDWLTANGYTVELIPGTSGALTDVADDTKSYDNWGIKTSGTMSWNTTFDAKKLTDDASLPNLEINSKDKTTGAALNPENKTLNIRVRASDVDGSEDGNSYHASAWSDEIHVSVNNSVPNFGEANLVQYENNTYATEIQRVPYKADMFISGENWRLEGEVTDNNGIKQITIGSTDLITNNDDDSYVSRDETKLPGVVKDESDNEIGYTFKLPVDTSAGKTKFEITIDAEDRDSQNPGYSSATYSVKIDNDAPEFRDGSDKDTLVLWSGNYGTGGTKIDSETFAIENSNGYTTIASKANESGSGFSKAIFYVERYTNNAGTISNRRIFDVMTAHGGTNANKKDLVAKASAQTGDVYINDDNLPVMKVSAAATGGRPDKYTIVIEQTGIGNEKAIGVGRAIFFGGNYKLITSWAKNSDDKITIQVAEEVETTYTEAEIVFGMVVNNNGESRNADGTVKSDDGDGMVESLTKSGTDYIWDATFDSTNIPDGPVEIHVVVFDEAGNARHGSAKAKISNNPPRLAKVYLGTDLNKNNKFEKNEFVEYSRTKKQNAADVADPTSQWKLESKNFKVKKDLAVVPEFVGGSGEIKMVLKRNVLEADGLKAVQGSGAELRQELSESTNPKASDVNPNTTHSKEWGETDLQDIASTFHKFYLSNTDLWGSDPSADNSYQKGAKAYSLTFWDSTEELVQGQTTQTAVLYLPSLELDIKDTTKPNVVVNKFFWNSSSANSLFNNSTAHGHIELEGDLETTDTWTSPFTGTSGLMDKDPKVSGKIVVRGTAYDDVCLDTIHVHFGEIDEDVATYDSATGTWNGAGSAISTVECSKCSGTGIMTCEEPNCMGDGKVPCTNPECHEGQVTCSNCHGAGSFECTVCKDSGQVGWVDCTNCAGGRTNADCTTCGGTGRVPCACQSDADHLGYLPCTATGCEGGLIPCNDANCKEGYEKCATCSGSGTCQNTVTGKQGTYKCSVGTVENRLTGSWQTNITVPKGYIICKTCDGNRSTTSGSTNVRYCTTCSYTGYVKCTTCNGTGDCVNCTGTGKTETTCSTCSGTAKIDCPTCESGWVPCNLGHDANFTQPCPNGTDGKTKCTVCENSGNVGWLDCKNTKDGIECVGGWITCATCNGRTTVDCSTCGGTTEVNCSICSGTGKDTCNVCEGFGQTGSFWKFTVLDDTALTDTIAENYFGVKAADKASLAYFSQNGHKVAWELEMFTDKIISTRAALDQILTVTAEDGAGITSDGRDAKEQSDVQEGEDADAVLHRPDYKMDVVPYITKVSTGRLSGVKDGYDDTIYNRTARGHYPVNAETVSGSAVDSIKLVGFNLGHATDIDPTTVANGAYTHTVNGVDSINNINNNNAKGGSTYTKAYSITDKDSWGHYYNMSQNEANNNNMTDDVIFDVWEFNSKAARTYENGGDLREPIVKINPSSGLVGMAFGNAGTKFSMPFTVGSQTSYSFKQYNYATYINIALDWDEAGNAHGISTGLDTYARDEKAGRMNYMYSKWGDSCGTGDDGNFSGNYANRFDCIGVSNSGTNNANIVNGVSAGTLVLYEHRFSSPSIAVTTKNGEGSYTGQPRVYLAYYDDIWNQIRFRVGTVPSGSTGKSTFDQFFNTTEKEKAFRNIQCTPIAGTNINDSGQAYLTLPNCGEYVSIDVIPGTSADSDVVVAVWYDATVGRLLYSYNTTPMAQKDKTLFDCNYDWAAAKEVKANAGEYCKVVVDENGGVHIASKTDSNQIVYCYLKSYTDTPSENNTIILENYEPYVTEIAVDAKVVGDNVIPYISYWASNRPKLAYIPEGFAKTTTNLPRNISGTSFTGDWEVTFLPTASKVVQDHMNVCAVSSAIAGKTSSTSANFHSAGGQENGTVYTNGSQNPFLGYAVREGTKFYIEVAQIKKD